MRVTVFADFRSTRSGDTIWTQNTSHYAFWRRYLDVFEHVTVVTRVQDEPATGLAVVTGPQVSFIGVPDYAGAWDYARRYARVHSAIAGACANDGAFILRVPGRLGTIAGRVLRRAGIPYGVEVRGNPLDVFARGTVRHPLRPLLRQLFAADLRRVVRNAAAASYVTSRALQELYPCPSYRIGVTDVELGAEAMRGDWKHADPAQARFRVVTVGSLAQLYKGTDVLLEALARCVARGLDVSLVVVGDGRYRARLEAMAVSLGLAARVDFRGRLPPGAAVRAELDAADLFVLPSRTEGLPRALIEAMARGLPCLASRVGGIPELLTDEDLLTPGNALELADRMTAVLGDAARRDRMAQRALQRAHAFHPELLQEGRRLFYHEVLERTRAARARPATLTADYARR